ncbi:DUF2249 domain-containing protein [Thermocrinis minervae]|uniref:Uncharacterized protein n=1 Tax=Thermocrinis minervae TaxID=381751 RepID=A0A1M6QR22_9AQUI|nr:DUF2249 domain-containing protein [Thermocrinis minervae]SHK22625.1 hypothetical protein SAMN05444391_0351 [Thermocrinis minervae]
MKNTLFGKISGRCFFGVKKGELFGFMPMGDALMCKSFNIVNNHDPLPLFPISVGWRYEEWGGTYWKVLINNIGG